MQDGLQGERWRAGLVGLGLGLGALLVLAGLMRLASRGIAPPGSGLIALACPTIVVVGAVAAVRGFCLGAPLGSWRTVLLAGLIMLAGGAFPWAYTPLLVRDRGMEGSGMLGTLIFLAVGLPGLVLVVVASIRGGWSAE